MMYNIHCGIQWQIPDFLSDGNGNVCSISHRLRDIRKTTFQKFDPDMMIKVNEKKNGSCAI